MRTSRSLLSILATLVIALAGCGGGTGGASGTIDSTSGSDQSEAPGAVPTQAIGEAPASQSTASEAPAATSTPSDAQAAGGGGGPATGVCELVTADELQGILGVAVNLTVFAGPPDTCDIQSSDGAALAATVLTVMSAATASAVYDAVAGAPNAVAISGIGDKAAYDPGQQVLIVLKADKVLTVAVFDDGTSDEAARLDVMKQIAAAAAGRM